MRKICYTIIQTIFTNIMHDNPKDKKLPCFNTAEVAFYFVNDTNYFNIL